MEPLLEFAVKLKINSRYKVLRTMPYAWKASINLNIITTFISNQNLKYYAIIFSYNLSENNLHK